MTSKEKKLENQLKVLDMWKIESNTSEYNLLRLKQEVDNCKKGLGGINIKPFYQREYKFNITQESALIESLIGGIPIHSVYMASDTSVTPHVLNVIDGQHRIMSIIRFLNDEYKLRGLEELKELNNLRFSQLHPKIQNILMYQVSLKCEIIHITDNPDLELEVFKRYNKGTNPLTQQEIRHVVFSSKFNDWLCNQIDIYQEDNLKKYIFDITKGKYKSKHVHGLFYLMASLYSHMNDDNYYEYNMQLKKTSKSPIFNVNKFTGINPSFKSTAYYITNFMAYCRQLSDEDIELKIDEIGKFIEGFTEFLYNVYGRMEPVHPLSRNIFDETIGKSVKAQPTMIMILLPLYVHLKECDINYDDIQATQELRKIISKSFEGTHIGITGKGKIIYTNISEITEDATTIITRVLEHYGK